jgi:hypothetical protein
VGVRVEGERDRAVTEPLGHDLRVDAGDQEQRGVRVPQIRAFLALVLLPDTAVWRYQDRHHERLMGGHRNVLQRLWLRAEILGTGPSDPAARLGEDQVVAIMERPDSLGRDPRVARALAVAILDHLERKPGSGMMLMRNAAKRASRLSAWLLLGALDDVALQSLMTQQVEDAAASMGLDLESLQQDSPEQLIEERAAAEERGRWTGD